MARKRAIDRIMSRIEPEEKKKVKTATLRKPTSRKPSQKEIGLGKLIQAGQIYPAQAGSTLAGFELGSERQRDIEKSIETAAGKKKKKTPLELFREAQRNATDIVNEARDQEALGIIDSSGIDLAREFATKEVVKAGKRAGFKGRSPKKGSKLFFDKKTGEPTDEKGDPLLTEPGSIRFNVRIRGRRENQENLKTSFLNNLQD